jgi:DNA-binding transcriptional regulator YiaG
MQITINHPASTYGVPVILDDAGHPLDYADGFRRCRYRLNMSTVEIGKHLGASGRTVEGYEQGRTIPVAALNVLSALINPPNQLKS